MPKSQEQCEQVYTSFEEIPRWMTFNDVADVLRISLASAYNLAELPDFPVTWFNAQKRIKRDKFFQWLEGKERQVPWQR